MLGPINSVVTVNLNDNDAAPPVLNPLQDAGFSSAALPGLLIATRPTTPRGSILWPSSTPATQSPKRGPKDCLDERRVNVSAAFFSPSSSTDGYFVERLYGASFPDSPARPRGLPRFAVS